MKKKKKGNWTVKVRCVVVKEVYCEDCTEEEAETEPFLHSLDELEIDMVDWEVDSIKENRK